MSKAEAIVWLAEARIERDRAAEAWNASGAEIKRLTAALAAEEAKNDTLKRGYYTAWNAVGNATAARDKAFRVERAAEK
jgi:hypothetical protein